MDNSTGLSHDNRDDGANCGGIHGKDTEDFTKMNKSKTLEELYSKDLIARDGEKFRSMIRKHGWRIYAQLHTPLDKQKIRYPSMTMFTS